MAKMDLAAMKAKMKMPKMDKDEIKAKVQAINWLLVLRVAQALVAFLVMGLAAYGMAPLIRANEPACEYANREDPIVANWYNMEIQVPSPPQINFLAFAPAFSIVSLAYILGAPMFFPKCKLTHSRTQPESSGCSLGLSNT